MEPSGRTTWPVVRPAPAELVHDDGNWRREHPSRAVHAAGNEHEAQHRGDCNSPRAVGNERRRGSERQRFRLRVGVFQFGSS